MLPAVSCSPIGAVFPQFPQESLGSGPSSHRLKASQNVSSGNGVPQERHSDGPVLSPRYQMRLFGVSRDVRVDEAPQRVVPGELGTVRRRYEARTEQVSGDYDSTCFVERTGGLGTSCEDAPPWPARHRA